MKLVIFDLDGVLADIKHIHYQTLNQALEELDEQYVISYEQHTTMYDGLKTYDKLRKLTADRGLPASEHQAIWRRKQELTVHALQCLQPDEHLQLILQALKSRGLKIACCSNSIRQSCYLVLCKKGVIEYFDLILSNEDVNQSKPHPEIYWRAMSLLEAHPSETLIVEDSPAGLAAAHAAGTAILQIKKPKDLSLNRILNYCEISQRITQKPKWRDEKLNIVIPMGGAGRRFAEKGYTFPKPLIEVEGRPMIQLVIENLQLAGRFIFIVDEQTLTQYNLQAVLQLLAPGCIVIPETGPRRGAAYATLLAEQYIDNDQPLIIANCDQLVEWDPLQFMYKAQEQNVDGSILTFESVHPKWSYARTNELGIVQEVAEKNPISNQATVGIYLWSKGSDYLRCLRQMIDKDIKVNGEFYVCPVFNEGIAEGLKFSTYHVDVMLGLGTPEDLETYLARNR